jgi:HK97 gp10 family phage protein|nr:MAG TPA: putative tail component [Bacteriophage sp.]
MNVEFEGAEKLIARLDKMSDEAAHKKSLETAALLVERSAREKAPKDTGALRRSIRSKVEGLEGIIYTPLEYAPYVEYGTGLFAEGNGRKDVPWNYQDDKGNWHSTSGLKPQPFMRPSLDENREKILDILKEGVMNDG